MKKELVSIITPAYNAQIYIPKTIESVVSQTYKNWEMIIIDDCSADSTKIIAKEFAAKEPRIAVLELQENSGPGIARNKGIDCAKGRYIAFLDADDYWAPDKLEKQIAFMTQNNLPFTFTQYYEFENDTGKILNLIKSPNKVNYRKMLRNDYIGCLTVIYDAKHLGKRYMPKIRRRQDWVLWISILKDINHAHSLQEPLAYYRLGNPSLSKDKLALLKYNFNVYRKELKMTYLKSVFMMINFLIHYTLYKNRSKIKLSKNHEFINA